MWKPRHIKFFSEKKKREERTIKLKGGLKITLPTKDYSVKDLRNLGEEGGLIYLYRNGLEISSFGNGVSGETITNYAFGYEFALQRKMKKMKLRKYCMAPASCCETSNWNCDDCSSNYKDEALERKGKGKKVGKAKRKKRDFIKVIEGRNASLLKKEPLKNKEILFDRDHGGKWR